MVEDRVQLLAPMNSVNNLIWGLAKGGEFYDQLNYSYHLKKGSAPWNS